MKLEITVTKAITDGVFRGKSVRREEILECDEPFEGQGSEEFNRLAALVFGNGNSVVSLCNGTEIATYMKKPRDVGTIVEGLPVSIVKYGLVR